MDIYQYFFLTQNLEKITVENCLAFTEKKKKELILLREKITEQLVKDENLIQKHTKDGLISSTDLNLLEQSKKNRLSAYNLILQLQDKILSNHILSAPWFANTSKTKTTQFLSQTEINNFLDVITILSLSIEISEILHDAIDEKNFSHPQDKLSEKIEHFAMKVYSLPNNGNDFLNKISMELMHLAIACVGLCAYFFIFVTISHFALIAAAVFVCTGLSFFGISGFIQFMNQKTEVVSSLIDIINYFKCQDLKFNFGSVFMEIPNKSYLSNQRNITRSGLLTIEPEAPISPDPKEFETEFETENEEFTFGLIYGNSEESPLDDTVNLTRLALKSIKRDSLDGGEQEDRNTIPPNVGSLKLVEMSSNGSNEYAEDEEDEGYEEISYGKENIQFNDDDWLISDTSSTQSNRSKTGNDAEIEDLGYKWECVGVPGKVRLSDNRSTMFYSQHPNCIVEEGYTLVHFKGANDA
jgi:hypothetical protein